MATTALTLAACWPATGGGPDRRAYNGLETAVTAATAPTLVEVWTATTDAGQRGVSSAVVSTDGLVHVTTESSVYGIDLRTGAVRWVESPYAGTGGVAMDTELAIGPPTGDLTLYVSIARGPVGWENAVFDTRDGSWISEPFGRQEGIRGGGGGLAPLAAFSTYELRGGGLRQGLSTFGGDVDVEVTDHPGQARMTVGYDLVFQAGSGLMTTEPGDGTEGNALRAFPYRGASDTCGAPGDAVFACPAWVTPLDGTTATTPVLSADGGTVYVATDAGTLSAVDAATGAVRWSAAVGSPVVAPPAVAPDAVLVPTVGGALVALGARRVWGRDVRAAVVVDRGQPAACAAGRRHRRRVRGRRGRHRGRVRHGRVRGVAVRPALVRRNGQRHHRCAGDQHGAGVRGHRRRSTDRLRGAADLASPAALSGRGACT